MLTRLIYKFAQVRVRYAPSPTGMLHLGNLRTALFNYLFAKQNNGKFILRIQNTDQKRLVKGAIENIYNTLSWVGIQIDQSPSKPGNYGPYVQSERKSIYQKYVELLKSQKGLVYECYCQNQNEEQKQPQQKRKCQCEKINQNMTCFSSKNGCKPALKLKVQKKPIKFKDVVFGELQYPSQSIQDFVIMKKDGLPTYHFANVVDDIQMKITHVLRGQQWLTSTPKHIQLYEIFKHQAPLFVHLPNINGSNGKKLSKRDKANSATYYQQKRYQPQAIINAIVLLGWVPSTSNKQFFLMNELINQFKLQNIQKSPAQLDLNKLDFFNKHYMKQKYIASNPSDVKKINDFKTFMGEDLSKYSNQQLFEMADIILKRIKNHKDTQKFKYLYSKPTLKSNGGKGLKDKNFTLSEEQLKNKINVLIQKLNDEKDLQNSKQFSEQDFHIIRHCITGQSSGPNAIKIVKILGIPEIISRLKQYLQSN